MAPNMIWVFVFLTIFLPYVTFKIWPGRGPYDFSLSFTLPFTAFQVASVWLVYFAIN